ncbi:VanZ family protein [Blastococcus sp. MG754426]|uniref:VanZ family protein n=1 Tax=unclassified Blastococcus TaxID=2619396 RepID=UPI001EF1032A|nr:MULTISPECIES: VanZ family protein [unclassified Blastococcus]MCF6509624.1 VanZ family protein [Blastococcus sp. MG754426]MCF6514029.1 VanZ family protein [Blastococcus sp. MG754427]MCF6737113.1 VanZ family protein [Blastococcus sp. KM273129]
MRTTRTALPQAAFAVALLVSAVVLFLPSSGVPTAPPGTDKAVHLLVFATLAGTGRWAGRPPVPLGSALLAYAAVSELVQGLTPIGRSMSAADVVADVVGIVVGLLAWEALTRRAR